MTNSVEALARDEIDVHAARGAVWKTLDTADGYRNVYAALCRWTWRSMVERRLDDELRFWHRLLLDAAGRIALHPAEPRRPRERARLDPVAAAERLRALADLVRMSIEAASASVIKDLTARAHVTEILRLLSAHAGGHVERDQIKIELGLKDANLSRVLTLLAANGLVERQPRGKAATFRITQRGLAVIDTGREQRETPPPLIPSVLPVRLEETARVFNSLSIVVSDPGSIAAANLHRGHRHGSSDHEPVYNVYLVEEALGATEPAGRESAAGAPQDLVH